MAADQQDACSVGVTGASKYPEQLPQRERNWDERDTDQKLQLLRREMRFLIDRNADLERRVRELERHDHNAFGQIVTPLRDHSLNEPLGYRRRNPFD